MKIRTIKFMLLGMIIFTFLVSCGSKDEAQKLPFLSEIEDKEVSLNFPEAVKSYTGYLDNVSSLKEVFENTDYDGDGLQDRVLQYFPDVSTKYYYILFGNGDSLELGPFLDDGLTITLLAADLTGDGNNEIIFCGEHSFSTGPETGSEIAVFGKEEGNYKQLALPASEASWIDSLYYTGFPIFGEVTEQENIITFSCPILEYEEKYIIKNQEELDWFFAYNDKELMQKEKTQLAFDAFSISLEESDKPQLVLDFGIWKTGPYFKAVLEWDGEKFIGASMKCTSVQSTSEENSDAQ